MVPTHTIGTSQNLIGDDARIQLIQDEIHWLSSYPTSSITTAFVFVNNPVSTGVFIMPSHKENIQPNSGPYALQLNHHANRAFLWAENQYCMIIKTVSFMQREKAPLGYLTDLEETKQILFDQLTHLAGEKAFQWAQQRAHVSSHCAVLVNTGDDDCNLEVGS
jgi:hypothetical protein